jgi:hypothetical protein
MLPPGTEVSRQLAQERHAELRRDWQWVNPTQQVVVESRRRRLRLRLGWLRPHIGTMRHAS